jgi:hypothetical protein
MSKGRRVVGGKRGGIFGRGFWSGIFSWVFIVGRGT